MNRIAFPARLHAALPLALLVGFHVLPWLQWEGRQALLLDLSARRFDLFGLTLWPGELGLLLCMAALLVVALALVTHVAGRLWCGHACPQTLWSTAFGWIERRTRQLLPASRAEPLLRHSLWIVMALWTGLSFVGLFTPIHGLLVRSVTLTLNGWEAFWILFYAAATWGNAGFLRVHVCRTLCPFARLQPLLSDGHTPRMLYMASRGEPRGARAPGLGSIVQRGRGLLDATTAQDYVFRHAHPQLAGDLPRFSTDRLGDCLDCGECARACPVGLDVRNGPLADCLACGACLRACDEMQHAAGFNRGLIRYTSPERAAGRAPKTLRPRSLALLGLFLVLLGTLWLTASSP